MIAANQMSSALVRTTSTATTFSTITTISATNWLRVDEISLAGCGMMIISSPENKAPGAFAKPPPSRAEQVVVVVDQQQQTKQPEANQCLVLTTAPTPAVVAKSGDNVGTAETESPAGTVGAFVVQLSSSNNDENEPPLDDWQRSFTAFITRPSTHRHTNTGQPIARRELNTWGRQLFYKNRPRRGAFQITTKVTRDNNDHDMSGYPTTTMTIVVPTMVHLRGYVAIAFETNAETVAWGEWLAAQRALYQSRPIPPPPIVVLVDDHTKNRRRRHHHEQQGMSIRQRKKATYMYMKGTFRFGLLAQMGIDLTIPPSETLIHYDGRHNAF
jgi:hypothetical protein